MVSIAVAPQLHTPGAHGHDRLRRSAIWYPDLPPASLNLNEDSFLQLQSYTWGYRPLFWTCFGGPGGIYLRHLTKMAVCWSGLRRIDFSFNTEVPAECRSFGRLEDSKYTHLIEFSIDGPRGEMIERVEIFQQYPEGGINALGWFLAEGALGSLKVCFHGVSLLRIYSRCIAEHTLSPLG